MTTILVICLCIWIFTGCKKEVDSVKQAKEQAKIDDAFIQNYIDANNLDAVKVKIGRADTTGIWYIITRPGNAATYFTNSSLLTVGYTGRLLETGTVFTQTGNFHPAYHLGDMIKGWQLGIPASKIQKGGAIRLLVASRYAYGPYNQEDIPANSVLDFDIELYDVTN
jgi:FKBP-type peptidyl-prolyl cis-trans isomerase FkpA